MVLETFKNLCQIHQFISQIYSKLDFRHLFNWKLLHFFTLWQNSVDLRFRWVKDVHLYFDFVDQQFSKISFLENFVMLLGNQPLFPICCVADADLWILASCKDHENIIKKCVDIDFFVVVCSTLKKFRWHEFQATCHLSATHRFIVYFDVHVKTEVAQFHIVIPVKKDAFKFQVVVNDSNWAYFLNRWNRLFIPLIFFI